jgi:hypothetical protein
MTVVEGSVTSVPPVPRYHDAVAASGTGHD